MLRTRTPLSLFRRINTARLACVRPPASVHPEPGSNSPLYVCLTHSKLLTLCFFSLISWLLFVCQWSLFFSLYFRKLILSLLPNCECKSINLFLIDQMFLNFIFISFTTLKISSYNHSICSTSLPVTLVWGCKDKKFILIRKLLFN